MAQEINHKALQTEVRFLSQAIPRGICGRQNGTGRDFSLTDSVFLSLYHSTSPPYLFPYMSRTIYRMIQEESAIIWEMIVCVILSKKVHMNMGPILNGYRDMVKRRYGPSCEHEQQLRNK